MYKRTALILFLSSLLGACALHSSQIWNNFGLRPLSVQSPEQGRSMRGTLRIAALGAPSWLNTREMYYQLDYHNLNKVSAYSKSRWLAPPPTMLANLLVEQLSRARLWQAVVGPRADILADYTLYLHLSRFQQIFKTRNQSYSLIVARASLIDDHHDSVIAQREFHFKVEAPTGDASGGVIAMNQASNDLAVAVERWLKDVSTRHRIGDVR